MNPPEPSNLAPHSGPLRRHWLFISILCVWLLGNFLTASRYPCPYLDEVSYADPAINLILHGKFVSTAFYAQRGDEFWAGNVPLYQGVLLPWLKVFGISIISVRSLDYVLFALLASMLYAVVLKLTASSRRPVAAGILFICLLLTGYGLMFDYRSGRPDILGMILVALPLLAWVARWRITIVFFFLSAFLIPWSGLQLLPMLVVICTFLLILDWRKHTPLFLAAGFGSALGLAALLGFYYSHGVLHSFFASAAVARAYRRWRLPRDFSLYILMAGAVATEICSIAQRGFQKKSTLIVGVGLSLIIGVALLITGKLEAYYAWMLYIPMSLALVVEWSKPELGRFSAITLQLTFFAAILSGPLLHGCSAVYNWPDRDPSIPEALVGRNLKRSDTVFADPSAYYALLHHGAIPYVGEYVEAMNRQDKDRTSLLFLKPKSASEIIARIGGTWKKVDEYVPLRTGFLGTRWNMGFLSEFDYALEVYRRGDPPSTGAAQ